LSLKIKLSIIFSVVVIVILVVNNMLNYYSTRDLLKQEQEKQMGLIAQEISIVLEHSEVALKKMEDSIGEKLRVAAIAAQNALPADIERVENHQLETLSRQLGVSHITLFQKKGDDIVGGKSSESEQINLSTKEWGYWFTAFQQLFDHQEVTIPEGQKLPNYWAGPKNRAASNPEYITKWGYYYDGTTNYIINPYVRDRQIIEMEQQVGPDSLVAKTLKKNRNILEITGFNPKTFGNPPIYTEVNNQKYIDLINQPIQFGTYTYDTADDVKSVRQAADTNKTVSYLMTVQGKKVYKSFVPISTNPPRVIGLVTDYMIIEKVLNQQLMQYLQISVLVLLFVFVLSYLFAVYTVRPIHRILNKVSEISQGRFDEKITIDRKDELGLLSEKVNIMSESLQSNTEELKRKNAEIQHQAYHDYLTGLPNGRMYNQQLERAIGTHMGSKEAGIFAVLFIDLDRFKYINDLFGHAVGDYLLKAVSNLISEQLEDGDFIARIGGDEFLLLFPHTSREETHRKTQGLIDVMSKPIDYEGNDLFVTPSIGISLYPEHDQGAVNLIKYADLAMYRAKEQGRNNYQFYMLDMNEMIVRRAALEKGLRKGLEQEEFILHYQPVIDLKSGGVVGSEALIRWNHEELGMVSPVEFIPIAEEVGLIGELGEWILRSACRQNKKWQDAGMPHMRIAVNLSARQFQQQNLVNSIMEVLAETELDPRYLELEITESVAMFNEEYIIAKMQALSNLGVRIAIDDFGTGYSSLSYLRKFPIHTLKIDKSFVDDIHIDSDDMQIITTIISMAHSLKLNVIAEGIETIQQLNFMKEHLCNEAQGYLFSRPISAEEFDQALANIREAAASFCESES
jgi:diguanylate cyclase (GGDEF)-like protein